MIAFLLYDLLITISPIHLFILLSCHPADLRLWSFSSYYPSYLPPIHPITHLLNRPSHPSSCLSVLHPSLHICFSFGSTSCSPLSFKSRSMHPFDPYTVLLSSQPTSCLSVHPFVLASIYDPASGLQSTICLFFDF